MDGGNFVLQILIALGFGSALGPLIAVLFNRNKTKSESANLKADATEAISRAAATVAANFEKMYERSLEEAQRATTEAIAARQEATAARREADASREAHEQSTRELRIVRQKLEQAIEMILESNPQADVRVLRVAGDE